MPIDNRAFFPPWAFHPRALSRAQFHTHTDTLMHTSHIMNTCSSARVYTPCTFNLWPQISRKRTFIASISPARFVGLFFLVDFSLRTLRLE